MPGPQYIKASKVRAFCNEKGKRVTPQFLRLVDEHLRQKLTAACSVHNGGRRTLDGTVAGFVGITSRPSLGGPLV
jgi:hypothetical protein